MDSNSTLKMMIDKNRTVSGAALKQLDSIGRCNKYFAPIDIASGVASVNAITDISRGTAIIAVGEFTLDATLGSIEHDVDALRNLSDNIEFVPTRDFIFLVAGEISNTSAKASMGNIGGVTAGSGVRSLGVTPIAEAANGTTRIVTSSTDANLASVGDSIVAAAVGDVDGNLTFYTAGDVSNKLSVDMSSIGVNTLFANSMHLYGIKMQGIGLFMFEDGLPSDTYEGIDWMYNDWTTKTDGGLRLCYPGWVSLK